MRMFSFAFALKGTFCEEACFVYNPVIPQSVGMRTSHTTPTSPLQLTRASHRHMPRIASALVKGTERRRVQRKLVIMSNRNKAKENAISVFLSGVLFMLVSIFFLRPQRQPRRRFKRRGDRKGASAFQTSPERKYDAKLEPYRQRTYKSKSKIVRKVNP